ncbi:hypothetical protein [Qipengyuania sp. ASV99]|uniref:hypothetical protein n=1 Tax=Qipengyuania sp. ASV99 TaxID=3399681 RepID=UPI003A4C6D47
MNRGANRAILAGALLALPAQLAAQDNPHDVPLSETAFVEQAPDSARTPEVAAPQQPVDARSKVYFPDEITPQSVAEARARAARQEQVEARLPTGSNDTFAQVSPDREGNQPVTQLTDPGTAQALAQLSDAERQVLLDAVEGTDICDSAQQIPAIQALCAQRIETRSAEFARDDAGPSAEDSLLGGGLDNSRLATLEAAIARLARNAGQSDDFSNQVIASVALGNAALSDAQATSAEGDPTGELSPETQGIVNAIVQQLGGN